MNFILALVKKTIYSPEQRAFTALLRQMRQNAGMTQEMLAEALNVPQSRISDYERGERQMDVIELYQYCIGLSVSLVEFVQRLTIDIEASNHQDLS